MNRSNKRKRYTGTFSTKSKFGGRPPKFLQSKDEEEIDKFSSSESENEISMQSLQNNKEKRTEELLLSDNNTGTTLFETTSCNEPVNSTDNCSSIVQAIENNTYSGKITFTAILQRVICKLCKKENIQSCLQKQLNPEETEVVYSFLVQDSVGMLSEIYLKNSSKS